MARTRQTANSGGRFRKLREAPSRLIARTPWMRRRYARYLVRSIKKQRAKGRRLPESLYGIERQLRNVPPPKQAETVEKLLEASSQWEPETAGRAMRRATTKQQRKSGKGGGTRPGMFPGQRTR